MKCGIRIFGDVAKGYKVCEINNPEDEGYALYTCHQNDTNTDVAGQWMFRVRIVDYRDKFLERMINRYKGS